MEVSLLLFAISKLDTEIRLLKFTAMLETFGIVTYKVNKKRKIVFKNNFAVSKWSYVFISFRMCREHHCCHADR